MCCLRHWTRKKQVNLIAHWSTFYLHWGYIDIHKIEYENNEIIVAPNTKLVAQPADISQK